MWDQANQTIRKSLSLHKACIQRPGYEIADQVRTVDRMSHHGSLGDPIFIFIFVFVFILNALFCRLLIKL